jgi:uncharacterized C2H2 Zn-finger protein
MKHTVACNALPAEEAATRKVCPLCGTGFYSASNMRRHFNQVHYRGESSRTEEFLANYAKMLADRATAPDGDEDESASERDDEDGAAKAVDRTVSAEEAATRKVCPLCGTGFYSASNMRRHFNQVHYRGESSRTEEFLANYAKMLADRATAPDGDEDESASERDDEDGAAKAVDRTVSAEEAATRKVCPLCGTVFYSASNMRRHFNQVHYRGESSRTEEFLANYAKMLADRATAPDGDEDESASERDDEDGAAKAVDRTVSAEEAATRKVCPLCGTVFYSASNMRRHFNQVHYRGESSRTEEFLANYAKMLADRATAPDGDEDKSASERDDEDGAAKDVDRTVSAEEAATRKVCPLCGTVFYSASNMRRHFNQVHYRGESSRTEEFLANYAKMLADRATAPDGDEDKSASERDDEDGAAKDVDRTVSAEEAATRKVCPLCGTVFYSASNMRRHFNQVHYRGESSRTEEFLANYAKMLADRATAPDGDEDESASERDDEDGAAKAVDRTVSAEEAATRKVCPLCGTVFYSASNMRRHFNQVHYRGESSRTEEFLANYAKMLADRATAPDGDEDESASERDDEDGAAKAVDRTVSAEEAATRKVCPLCGTVFYSASNMRRHFNQVHYRGESSRTEEFLANYAKMLADRATAPDGDEDESASERDDEDGAAKAVDRTVSAEEAATRKVCPLCGTVFYSASNMRRHFNQVHYRGESSRTEEFLANYAKMLADRATAPDGDEDESASERDDEHGAAKAVDRTVSAEEAATRKVCPLCGTVFYSASNMRRHFNQVHYRGESSRTEEFLANYAKMLADRATAPDGDEDESASERDDEDGAAKAVDRTVSAEEAATRKVCPLCGTVFYSASNMRRHFNQVHYRGESSRTEEFLANYAKMLADRATAPDGDEDESASERDDEDGAAKAVDRTVSAEEAATRKVCPLCGTVFYSASNMRRHFNQVHYRGESSRTEEFLANYAKMLADRATAPDGDEDESASERDDEDGAAKAVDRTVSAEEAATRKVCPLCGTVFYSASNMRRHFNQVHYRGESSRTEEFLANYAKMLADRATAPDGDEDESASERDDEDGAAKAVDRTVSAEEAATRKVCPLCGTVFYSASNMRRHFNQVHYRGESSRTEEFLANYAKMLADRATAPDGDEDESASERDDEDGAAKAVDRTVSAEEAATRKVCPLCGTVFYAASNMRRHFNQVHYRGESSRTEEFLANYAKMLADRATAPDGDEDESASERDDEDGAAKAVDRTVSAEEAATRKVCPLCGTVFYSASNMRRHFNQVHYRGESSRTEEFLANYAKMLADRATAPDGDEDESASERDDEDGAAKAVDRTVSAEEAATRKVCPLCGTVFYSASNMRRHFNQVHYRGESSRTEEFLANYAKMLADRATAPDGDEDESASERDDEDGAAKAVDRTVSAEEAATRKVCPLCGTVFYSASNMRRHFNQVHYRGESSRTEEFLANYAKMLADRATAPDGDEDESASERDDEDGAAKAVDRTVSAEEAATRKVCPLCGTVFYSASNMRRHFNQVHYRGESSRTEEFLANYAKMLADRATAPDGDEDESASERDDEDGAAKAVDRTVSAEEAATRKVCPLCGTVFYSASNMRRHFNQVHYRGESSRTEEFLANYAKMLADRATAPDGDEDESASERDDEDGAAKAVDRTVSAEEAATRKVCPLCGTVFYSASNMRRHFNQVHYRGESSRTEEFLANYAKMLADRATAPDGDEDESASERDDEDGAAKAVDRTVSAEEAATRKVCPLCGTVFYSASNMRRHFNQVHYRGESSRTEEFLANYAKMLADRATAPDGDEDESASERDDEDGAAKAVDRTVSAEEAATRKVCPLCGTVFYSASNMRRHFNQVHYRGESSRTEEFLANYAKMLADRATAPDGDEDESASERDDEHGAAKAVDRTVSAEEAATRKVCPLCGTVFYSASNMRRHFNQVHYRGESSRTEEFLANYAKMLADRATAPDGDEDESASERDDEDGAAKAVDRTVSAEEAATRKVCPLCGTVFYSASNMRRHFNQVHYRGESSRTEEFLANYAKMLADRATAPDGDEDESASERDDEDGAAKAVDRTVSAEEAATRKVCPLCGTVFYSASNMRRHFNQVHYRGESSRTEEFLANYAKMLADRATAPDGDEDKSASERDDEDGAAKAVDRTVSAEEAATRKVCPLCGTGFYSASNMRRHFNQVHYRGESSRTEEFLANYAKMLADRATAPDGDEDESASERDDEDGAAKAVDRTVSAEEAATRKVCPLCGTVFYSASNMRRHFNQVHYRGESSRTEEFLANYAKMLADRATAPDGDEDKSASERDDEDGAAKAVDRTVSAEEAATRKVCPLCGTVFYSASNMRRHFNQVHYRGESSRTEEFLANYAKMLADRATAPDGDEDESASERDDEHGAAKAVDRTVSAEEAATRKVCPLCGTVFYSASNMRRHFNQVHYRGESSRTEEFLANYAKMLADRATAPDGDEDESASERDDEDGAAKAVDRTVSAEEAATRKVCPLCGTVFYSASNMRRHFNQVHYRGESSRTEEFLANYAKMLADRATAPDGDEDESASERDDEDGAAKAVDRTVSAEEAATRKVCPLCGTVFYSASNMRRHFNQVHYRGESSRTEEFLANYAKMLADRATAPDGDEDESASERDDEDGAAKAVDRTVSAEEAATRKVCPLCGTVFYSASNMRRHFNQVHYRGESSRTEEFLANYAKMLADRATAPDGDEDESASERDDEDGAAKAVDRTVSAEEAATRKVCPLCGTVFYSASNMRRHFNQVHYRGESSRTEEFLANYAKMLADRATAPDGDEDESASERDDEDGAAKAVDRTVSAEEAATRKVCPLCGTVFYSASNMRRHFNQVHYRGESSRTEEFLANYAKMLADRATAPDGDEDESASERDDEDGAAKAVDRTVSAEEAATRKVCPLCGTVFYSASNMRRHFNQVHYRGESSRTEEFLANYAKMLADRATAPDGDEDESASERDDEDGAAKAVDRTVSAEEAATRKVCPLCGTVFYSASNMRRHFNQVHYRGESSRTEEFLANYAKMLADRATAPDGDEDESASERDDEDGAAKAVDRTVSAEEAATRKVCPLCGTVFYSASNMRRHFNQVHYRGESSRTEEFLANYAKMLADRATAPDGDEDKSASERDDEDGAAKDEYPGNIPGGNGSGSFDFCNQ